MLCPKCSTPLPRREHEGVTAFVCGACLGVWMPRTGLERTVRDSAAQQGVSLDEVRLVEGPARPTSVRCPTCSETRLEWLMLRGVRVERCPHCQGVFVEPGEPEMITRRVLLAKRESEPAQDAWLRVHEMARHFARRQRDGAD